MTDRFTCEHCGGTFEKEWTDDEAQAEADDLWGSALGDDPAVISENGFQSMIAWTRKTGRLP